MGRQRQPEYLSLRAIAEELLCAGTDQSELRAATIRLYKLLSEMSGLSETSTHEDDSHETALASGKAISPRDAARCVLDYYRTTQFLRGAYAAIRTAQLRFPGPPIEILYACCGPFAPFAVLLASVFSEAEIQFTLLDIHARSIAGVKRIFATCELDRHVREYANVDAVNYRQPADRALHIVIVEAMQKALEKEPQVEIVVNLAPQLCAEGFLIPEQITIDVCLTESAAFLQQAEAEEAGKVQLAGAEYPAAARSSNDATMVLGRVFELSAARFKRPGAPGAGNGFATASQFAPSIIEIPPATNGCWRVMLNTAVKVFGEIALNEGESGITFPLLLHDLGTPSAGQKIEFRYAVGSDPGLRYRVIQEGQGGVKM
jgi:hypothetical protein